MKTRFSKTMLIEKLTVGREAHRALFEKAIEGYRKDVIRQLETNLEKVKKGSRERVYIYDPVPEDHTRDYTTAIELITASTEDSIELDFADFRRYVMDDWDWKPTWTASNSKYTT